MAGRPRKDEQIKTKSRNGTGTITKCVLKNDKKERRSTQLCKICGECKKKNTCPRTKETACKKCKECTNKNCPIYYISVKYKAFSPQKHNSKREYLGSFDTQKEAQESIDKYINGGFTKKNDITLFKILESKGAKKLNANLIVQSSDDRNECIRNKMQKQGIGNKPIQKITTDDIQEYLNGLKDSSAQSEIDKNKDEIKSAFAYAMQHKLILENPTKNLVEVISSIPTKVARPFELEEQQLILDYINDNNNINKLTDIRSRMDSITFRNIVRLAFSTGQRIGELLALIQTEKKHSIDINFEKKTFIISKTITHEKNKLVLVNRTKNDKKRLRQGLPREREISFSIAPPNVIENIFTSQIEHSKQNPNNTQHFVFCNSDGTFVDQHQVTTTFKRICRELHIQDDNPKGCFIHQARHSFVTRCLESRNESRNYCRFNRRYCRTSTKNLCSHSTKI